MSQQQDSTTILNTKLTELLDLMTMHMATADTQLDIKPELETMIMSELSELLQHELLESVIKVDYQAEEREVQLKFNWIIHSMSVQVQQFLDRASFQAGNSHLLVIQV